MAEEFYSFEKALEELRLKDAELKRLVSENVIRAFRDGDRMKLRREDVEKLKSELTEPSGTEELVFEEDAAEDPGMATVPLSEAETLVDAPAPKPAAAPPARPAAGARAGAAKKPAPAIRPRPIVKKKEEVAAETTGDSAIVKAALALTALVLLVSLFVAFDAASGSPGNISKAFANMFAAKG